ncbi:hypothetical protein C0J52_13776 [Blattella germanica]|nr:hypothetical protein C0J52_13776 [Blattella germanica]
MVIISGGWTRGCRDHIVRQWHEACPRVWYTDQIHKPDQVILCSTFLAPAWGIFPGYLGYSPLPVPYYSSLIPQQFQPQPAFAYSLYTTHGASAGAALPPAPMAKSIYTAPDDTFRGYSFQTEYEGGGKSEVVFVTGPQANQILQKSVDLFRSIVPTELGQITGRSLNSNTTNSSATTVSPATNPVPSESPLASLYRIQLYPADTSPLVGQAPSLQNLVYSITNDITNSVKDANENDEAQESMIHEVGATVTVPPPEVQNATTAAPSSTSQPSSTAANTVGSSTTIATTTAAASTTNSPTPTQETNEVAESNTTTASDEIMETTST